MDDQYAEGVTPDQQQSQDSVPATDDAGTASASDPAMPSQIEVTLTQAQYDYFANSARACVTLGVLSLVLSAFILGAVLYGHFSRGWRQ